MKIAAQFLTFLFLVQNFHWTVKAFNIPSASWDHRYQDWNQEEESKSKFVRSTGREEWESNEEDTTTRNIRIRDNENDEEKGGERKDNFDERGTEFEGDIKLPDHASSGLISQNSRWPHARVVYEIDPGFSGKDRELIQGAMREITQKTCIQFQERRGGENEFVFIKRGQPGSGCWAELGRLGRRQVANLEHGGCTHHGVIMHELIHVLGFHHEQTRPDRDNFVQIDENNITPGNRHNFKKYRTEEVTVFNLPYDYNSIMHYSAYAFARDPSRKSIIAKNPNVRIGQRESLSAGDVKKLQLMYKTTNCGGGGGPMGRMGRMGGGGGNWKLDLFEHSDHQGGSIHVSGRKGECVNVYARQTCHHGQCKSFNDNASSVNTHNTCVILYEHANCSGAAKIFRPGTHCHFNFADCSFNDKVSSVGSC